MNEYLKFIFIDITKRKKKKRGGREKEREISEILFKYLVFFLNS